MNRAKSCLAACSLAVLVLAIASGCSGDDSNERQTQAQDDEDTGAAIGDAADAGPSTDASDRRDTGAQEADDDAGEGPDAQASATQPCCVSNQVTTCSCPGDQACDFEFKACGSGVCVAADQSCPQ